MVAFPPFFSWCFWEGYHAALWTQFLRHHPQEQARIGQKVFHLEDLHAGDILCFPGHVALYLGRKKVIHASGKFGQVMISKLDDPYLADLRKQFLFGVRTGIPIAQ